MVRGALLRQRGRFALIALTVALGVALASAMLDVLFDVGDKVNQELKAYGANITVTSKNASVLQDVYGIENAQVGGAGLMEESDLGKIKTIFWTNKAERPSLCSARGSRIRWCCRRATPLRRERRN